jgi:hypothetical protein
MDFITNLPPSNFYDSILVVVALVENPGFTTGVYD